MSFNSNRHSVVVGCSGKLVKRSAEVVLRDKHGCGRRIFAKHYRPFAQAAGRTCDNLSGGRRSRLDGRNNAMRQPKEYRRPAKLQAMIHPGDGKAPIECSVVEIAERTALLSVSDADAVPISFVLTFAGGTQVHRQCTVLSRQPGQIVVLMLKSEP
jgi:hypothetical protein